MIAEFLWINIPLMVLAFALWVGIPMWVVLRRPDRDPSETRTVPAYLSQRGAMAAAFPAMSDKPHTGSNLQPSRVWRQRNSGSAAIMKKASA